ncbi:MAG: nitrate/nitrite transporter [Myxococcota bacterium]|jgi:NNP family nitrate/nitrite transporter-like MFS transporter|nr:nitrate/nitrite transporter [Myxococcota bacterium]
MKTPEQWNVEDPTFWEAQGKRIAQRNLWISIPNLLLGFAVWLYWGMIIVRMQSLHDGDPTLFGFSFGNDGMPLTGMDYQALLYTLPAVAGLAGATLRIPNSFMIAICGGRNAKFMTTLLLIMPSLGAGIALQNPDTSFLIFVVLAALSGVGGGAFASSMSNISFFFPKRMQGLSLGLNAGLGNLGVCVMQFLIPWVITFGLFGGESLPLGEKSIWLHNAGLIWVPILATVAILAFLLMNNLPMHKCGPTPLAVGKYIWLEMLGFVGAGVGIALLLTPWGGFPELLKIFVVLVVAVVVTLALMRFLTPRPIRTNLQDQFEIFGNKHTWVMTWLYTMTFGSFIGYSAAFPKLITDVFGYVRVDENGQTLPKAIENIHAIDAFKYAFLGAMVGALIRPVGGWLSDKLGGARVTQWDTWIMVAATIGCGYVVSLANGSPHPEQYFGPFLGLFLLLFVTTGIGNGSTFRMVPMIFSKAQAGPVLGWTSAIAAYGAFLIPKIFATQIQAGHPEYALYGFAVYYASCLVVNWWFYARKNAETPC